MRRTLIAASVPVISIVAGSQPALAGPAAPAAEPENEANVTWSPPLDGHTRAADHWHVGGVLHVGARISAPGGITGWTLAVEPGADAAYPGYGPLCSEHFAEPVTRAAVHCDWDTTHRPGGHPSANQPYVLRITAEESDAPLHDGWRDVTVSNPASAPEGLAGEASDGHVRLRWSPAPEPDTAGYAVARRRRNGRWQLVGSPTGPAWDDTPAAPGTYAFRIGTLRRDDASGTPAYWTTSEAFEVPAPRDPAGAPQADADGSPSAADPGSSEAHDPPPASESGPPPASAPRPAPRPAPEPAPAPAPEPPPAPAPGPSPAAGRGAPPPPPPAAGSGPPALPPTVWTVALRRSTGSTPPAPPIPRRVAAPVERDPDGGFALDLPYGPEAGSPPPDRPDAAPGAAPAPPGPVHQPDEPPRRRALAALAFAEACFMLSLQGRYVLHRAGAHRFGRGARRTLQRCPCCRAPVPQPVR